MIYPATNEYLDFAIESLKEGNIIVYPTDTLYGFGVDATNSEAIRKLNKIKGRVRPLSIIVNNINEISTVAHIENYAKKMINQLLPGPYTLLFKSIPSTISTLIYAGSPLVGIRIPKHFFPLEIVKELNAPIVTTSVNRHDKEPLNNVTQAEIDFPSVNIFEDINHKNSKPSTIIDLSSQKYQLIRKGKGEFPL